MAFVNPDRFSQMLVTHPVLLMSTRSGRNCTIAPLTWYLPLSLDPPMIGVSLKPSSMSYQYLRESGDFVLGVPGEWMLKTIHFCGLHTGRDIDKIRHLNLPTSRAQSVSPLILSSCLANIECRVRDIIPTGNRPFITAEILTITADSQFYYDGWLENIRLVYYLGGARYRVGDEITEMSSVRPGSTPFDTIGE